jgi:hypothetical protein
VNIKKVNNNNNNNDIDNNDDFDNNNDNNDNNNDITLNIQNFADMFDILSIDLLLSFVNYLVQRTVSIVEILF